jgi:hypothetical protein
VNTWVNPWRVTPMPWTSAKFEEYRGIDQSANRTSKAGLASSGQWDAAIFGSSRADIAFDPRDPAWGGLRVANLGLDAANIDENEAMFDYFMEYQSPKLVVFLVDAGDLTKPNPTFNGTDFAASPLVEERQPLERELRYHSGISALSSSLKVLARSTRHKVADHTPEGFRRVATRLHDPRSQIGSLYLATVWRLAHDRAVFDAMNDGKIERLKRIIAKCREKNARLVFVLPPNHAAFQLSFEILKDADPYFERDRSELARLVADANRDGAGASPVELWDFQDMHPINSPPLPLAKGDQMQDWVDIFHFVPRIGALIIRRIQGEEGDYGVCLTPENVSARIESIRVGLNEWAERHPDDLAFLRQSLDAFGPLPHTGGRR